ncbi:hypothetical protein CHLRE_10g455451v5 [Chlamydomonas reinhardtii]|uniref:Uncharacterized protein n=1 Tax=Chlamydomonas reinhardtii TaxID=3055 RepID=A0A2K3DBG4_CHLRE|nr:uncharacterized protein CHLRE_10g455451v5 [Chlamydomonas reinhardtii]PNW77879.1 hypothetical protein CHLRE_10g455451v5 [Chlamydomonas reinhardtii]
MRAVARTAHMKAQRCSAPRHHQRPLSSQAGRRTQPAVVFCTAAGDAPPPPAASPSPLAPPATATGAAVSAPLASGAARQGGPLPAAAASASTSAAAAALPPPPPPPVPPQGATTTGAATEAAAAAAAASGASGGMGPALTPNSELVARRRQRVAAEIIEASRRAGVAASPEAIRDGLATLEALLPGFTPNLDTLKAADWGRLAADAPAVANKIILLKTHHPGLNLAKALTAQPRLLLQSPEQLDRSARMVRQLLSRAKDPDRLLGAEPSLLEPKALISVLITVTKWYFLEKDPIEVLEADPELVQRAQDYDVPFEPVYMNEDGTWTAPLLNYKEKRTAWQKYIDQTFYKQP